MPGKGRPIPKGETLNPAGRPRGARNKVTVMMQDVILAATDRIDGIEELVRWYHADPKNRYAFWTTIAPRLLPKTIEGTIETRESEDRTRCVEFFFVNADGSRADFDMLDTEPQLLDGPGTHGGSRR
jgi:hypothetical protein